ncbi:hypothetical protein LH464_22040 [Neorhizobium sp. T786]|uniref:hypothetical protein n=1 Tax=Pseudorhizobium xiangyangii TaxID=2883104 RepID=UPI001D001765|nr:hypothetical protein [Neorhizobium xiangyangii]MCB5205152.1 hypothetical protein [Neorhizobium xiangyangii]
MTDRPNAFAKLDSFKPRAPDAVPPQAVEQVEAIAKSRGFVDDQKMPERTLRKNRNGSSVAHTTATMRVVTEDWNAFVAWCDAERMTYKEAFKRLLQAAKVL